MPKKPAKSLSPGFSMIEILMCLALLGLLASLAAPVAQNMNQRRQEQELRRSLQEIRAAIDQYKRAVDEGKILASAPASSYPASLAILVAGAPDIKSPVRRKIFFLRRIPRDPFNDSAASAGSTGASATANTQQTQTQTQVWGLRSYASEATDPREGTDVYDVYSLSRRIGLNGIPYSQW